MDTTTQLNHISLCAGYGGIDLGLKRVISNLRTIAVSEIEAFACANLVAKMEAGLMDAAPIWTDLKTFPYAEFSGRVDILSGGYPCQPFSGAGKRLGKNDPRHLWPWIADGIAAMRPSLCFFENVEGHITLGLPDVIEDLGRLGYRATWGIFSASECGAPHRRKRVFILAHRNGAGLEGLLSELAHSQRWQESMRSITGSGQFSRDGQLANPLCDGSGESGVVQQGTDGPKSFSNGTTRGTWPARPGHAQFSWEPPRVVGHSKSREDNGRESCNMGIETSSRSSSNDAANAASEGLGDTKSLGSTARRPKHEGLGGELCAAGTSSQGVLGDTTSQGSQERSPGCVDSAVQATECGGRSSLNGQTEPTLGGDSDGSSGGMDYAELCESCDNRTDELRLLGNGVVPATAALAFRTLLQQLLTN